MLRSLLARIAGNLRYKLLVLVLFPVLLVMPVVIGLAYLWSNEVSYRQLLMKVNTDLSVAHEAFTGTQQRLLGQLTLIAESYPFQNAARAMMSGFPEDYLMVDQLERVKREGAFDFVHLLDLSGCDLIGNKGCRLHTGRLLQQAADEGPQVGIEIYPSQALATIDPKLAERVYLPLVDTPRALPTSRTAEDRGMVIRVIYPIMTSYGEVYAYLSAGLLLNGNFEFVDNLRDLVYSSGSLAEDSLGTVTVFLEDVRISTNVPSRLDSPNRRALGTRVSQEVREQVLGRGEPWIDRAFVVSEWYVSAYEPIVDVNGERVGILYAGFLEAPFKASYYQALAWLLVLFALVTLVSVVVAVAGAKAIFRPIEAMAQVIREVRKGHDLRIGKLDSRDEIAELASRFDDMLDQLQQQRQQIESAAAVLEHKVEERTGELQRKTRDLQENLDLLNRTRQQLVAKEKLAAIGELTAGIAHEINNPTAVILGHMDLLMAELGDVGEPVRQDAELIVQQVYRIRSIINNLLQYSRPSDYISQVTSVDLNKVVNDSLVLVKHDLERKAARLRLDLRARTRVGGNHQQFQQVLINLLVNAMNAIEPEGRVTVRTRDWRGDGVLLMVRDNGCGIDERTLPRIFDPFFSKTKGGTGLGLSVSYGILQRFGAEIEVRSRPGVGTAFFIWFQTEPPQDPEGDALIEQIA